jgi:hypothetical protein
MKGGVVFLSDAKTAVARKLWGTFSGKKLAYFIQL